MRYAHIFWDYSIDFDRTGLALLRYLLKEAEDATKYSSSTTVIENAQIVHKGIT